MPSPFFPMFQGLNNPSLKSNKYSKYSLGYRAAALQLELSFAYLTSGLQAGCSLAAVELPSLDLKIRTGSFQTGMPPQLGKEMHYGTLRDTA